MNIRDFGEKISRFSVEKPIETLFILLLVLLTFIVSKLYFTVDYNDEDWEQFKTEHHCQIRFTKTGTQRASWVCDDGKTYFRWRQQR